MRKKNIQLVLALILTTFSVFAQLSDTKGKTLQTSIYFEKIYGHVDRDFYSPGDTIYYKSYLLNGQQNKPVSGFRNIYIQLITEKGKIISQQSLLSNKGIGAGSLIIPNQIKSAYYTFRILTSYQNNFKESEYYHKRIWVSEPVNSTEINQEESTTKSDNIDVAFLPEGGNLIANQINIVALKAINQKGEGVEVEGKIISGSQEVVSQFKTQYKGMGKFVFRPEENKKYYAVLNNYPNYKKEITLSGNMAVGINFRYSGTKASVTLLMNDDNFLDKKLFLIVMHKGNPVFSKEILIKSKKESILFERNVLPAGISKITILSENMKPHAERLIFNNNISPNNVKITSNKQQYNVREKVNLQLGVESVYEDTCVNYMSMAVVNNNYLNEYQPSQNILSYLLLDSELKNKIEQPLSYFTSDSALSSAQKLDLLMTTHGWRTYSYLWDTMPKLSEQQLKKVSDAGIIVKGKMTKVIGSKPIVKGKVSMTIVDDRFIMKHTTTDKKGAFEFENIYLTDTVKMALHYSSSKGNKTVNVDLEPIFDINTDADKKFLKEQLASPKPHVDFYQGIFVSNNAETKFKLKKGVILLDNIDVVENKVEKKPDNQVYANADASHILTERDEMFPDLLTYILNNEINASVMDNELVLKGATTFIEGDNGALITVDGIPVSDGMGYLTGLSLQEVDRVDILTSPTNVAIFGVEGANGVVAIHTKRGDAHVNIKKFVPGMIAKQIAGYAQYKTFYTPKYNLRNNPLIPDYRPTMYWNPYVNLKGGQSADYSFYTSDEQGDYTILVEGISKNGTICIGSVSIKVE